MNEDNEELKLGLEAVELAINEKKTEQATSVVAANEQILESERKSLSTLEKKVSYLKEESRVIDELLEERLKLSELDVKSPETEKFKNAIKVFTGTDKSYTSPSVKYSGTGEGLNIYGKGIYTTTSEDKAEKYSEIVNLKNRPNIVELVNNLANSALFDTRNMSQDGIKILQSQIEQYKKYVYSEIIPNEKINKGYLDWNKLYTSDEVKDILSSIVISMIKNVDIVDSAKGLDLLPSIYSKLSKGATGGEIFDSVEELISGDIGYSGVYSNNTSKLFHNIGFTGNKIHSRGLNDFVKNPVLDYLIYDDSDIKINNQRDAAFFESKAAIENLKNSFDFLNSFYKNISNLQIEDKRGFFSLGRSYEKWGFVDGDLAYDSDNVTKNVKIQDFKNNLSSTIDNYCNKKMESFISNYRAVLFGSGDEQQVSKNPKLLLDAPQWKKEADILFNNIKRDVDWWDDQRKFDNNYKNAIIPYSGNGLSTLNEQSERIYSKRDVIRMGGPTNDGSIIYLSANDVKITDVDNIETKTKNNGSGGGSGNNGRNNNSESADNIFNDSLNKRRLEILKNAESLDDTIRTLRNAYHKMEKNDAVIAGVLSSEFSTVDELNYASSYSNRRSKLGNYGSYEVDEDGNKIEDTFSGVGLLGKFHKLKENLDELAKAYSNENLSQEERIKLVKEIDDTYENYKETVKELTKEVTNLNKESEIEFSKRGLGHRSYDSYKYALKRDKNQQAEFENEYPANFSTTGNLKQSFLKTVFNKSVGYRQQQGLTGFLANVGYNKSGTLLSIELGILGKAVKEAEKAMLQFSKESVQAYGELQSIKTNLGIVYSSQAEADKTFGEIAQYSVKSPFGVQTVSEYAVLLKQSGIYASDLMDTLKQIGDVAGGNQQKFANIANAFSQIEANGKATTRQLRQFATAGIPIYKELIKAYGEVKGDNVGIEQIRKLTEEGKISAQVIEKAFSNMTGPGGTFENAVNIGAKTWRARQQNLADAKQLAQAAFGETAIGFGGTGRNDSLAERFLGLKESLFEVIQNTATLHNIKKSISNIENQNDIVAQYDRQIAALEAAGTNPELVEELKKLREEATQVINPDTQRSIYETMYDKAKNELNTALENNELVSRAKEDDRKYGKFRNYYVVEEDGKLNVYNGSDPEPTNRYTPQEVLAGKAIAENAEKNLQNEVSASKIEELKNEVEKYREIATMSKSISFFNSGNEMLDKAINKNDKSLAILKQKSDTAYKATTEGKEAEYNKKRKEWNDLVDVYNKYSPFVSETGQLLKTFKGTTEEAVEIFKSGIITPLDKIDLRPEKLSIEENSLLTEKQKEDRRNEWNEFRKNLTDQVDTVLNASDVSESAKLELANFRDLITATENNSPEDVKTVLSNFYELIEVFQKNGLDTIAELLSFASSKRKKTGQPLTYEEANKSKDVFPLWQRILNSSLGVDLEYFKRGAIKNGKQAVDLFEQNSQRDIIKSTMRSLLNNNSLKNVVGNIAYTRESLRTGNNSKDGTLTVNWAETSKKMLDAAISMKATADNTRAYSDALDNELSTIKDAFAEMLTTTESAANIYDPEYQKVIGEYYKKLEATGINAFDLSTIKASKTLDEFRENAVNALATLETQKQTLKETTSVLADFKESVKSLSDEIAKIKVETDVYSGKYTGTALYDALGGDYESLKEFFIKIEELKNNPEYKDLNWTDIMSTIINTDPKSLLKENNALLTQSRLTYEGEKGKFDEKNDNLQKILDEKVDVRTSYRTQIEKLQSQLADEKLKQDKLNGELREASKNRYWSKADEIRSVLDTEVNGTVSNLEKEIEVLQGKQKANQQDINSTVAAQNNLGTPQEQLSENEKSELALLSTIAENIILIRQKTDATLGGEYAKNLNTIYTHQSPDNLTDYEKLLKHDGGLNFWATVSEGNNVWGKNSWKEQRALNYMGVKDGTTMNDFVLKQFFNEDGSLNLQRTEDLYKNTGGVWKDQGSVNGNFKAIKQYITDIAQLQDAEIKAQDEFTKLGTTIKDTFKDSIVQGFGESMKLIGKDIRDMTDCADDLRTTWAAVNEKMLDGIGAAMTQAGLAMITKDPEHWYKGAALVAAGGVTQFLSGLFTDDSKKDDEEKRLNSLKDLLSDIIDQARTDAEYYQRNVLHTRALGEISDIQTHSVHDAIIAPNGNVISTDPEDYLIATKTPGNYANLSGNGNTTVNFNLIDQSTGVQVSEIKQTKNRDGSIDISAVVISKVSRAIADGEMDDAFAEREMKINGRSYAY